MMMIIKRRKRLKVLTLFEPAFLLVWISTFLCLSCVHCRNFNCAQLHHISVSCRSSTALVLFSITDCVFTEMRHSENCCQAEEGAEMLWLWLVHCCTLFGCWTHILLKYISRKNWSKTAIPALSSGPSNLQQSIWGRHHQLDDQHRNPDVKKKDHLWATN